MEVFTDLTLMRVLVAMGLARPDAMVPAPHERSRVTG